MCVVYSDNTVLFNRADSTKLLISAFFLTRLIEFVFDFTKTYLLHIIRYLRY